MLGSLINERYRLEAELGQGGMGIVYRAHDNLLGRDVAIKLVSGDALGTKGRVRLLNEARAVAKLNHANIVSVYDAGEFDGGAFIVMELIDGETLIEKPPESIDDIVAVARQVCLALNHAHSNGVIHRDLKPENVMIEPGGTVRLMDFGLARHGASRITGEGSILGTLFYLAPELAQGSKLDGRADLYALGVMLYEMTTGDLPFMSDDPVVLISQHLFAPVVPPSEKQTGIPAALDMLIVHLLNKHPDDRPASASQVLQELDKFDFLGTETAPTDLRATAPERAQAIDAAAQVPAFLEAGLETAGESRDVFVGRERELAQLNGFLEAALGGEGQVAFVSGEAGRGKTALVRAFARLAQESDPEVVVVLGSCSDIYGIGDPFLPFQDVFAMLSGDVETMWETGTISRDHAVRLWNVFPEMAQALLARGIDLIDVLVPGNVLVSNAKAVAAGPNGWVEQLTKAAHRVREGSSETRQNQIFEQCANVLRRLSKKFPLVLILDDLQWADAASINLLFHLGRRIAGSRILVLGTYRSDEIPLGRGEERHPLDGVLNDFKRLYGDIFVEMDIIQGTARRDFVDALLDEEPNRLDDSFRQALFGHTEGHALFTVELLHDLKARRILVKDKQNHWVLHGSLDWGSLPARLVGVVAERINRLDDSQRQVLEAACVEGEKFTAEVIAATLGITQSEMVQALSQELEKRHLLIRERGDRQGRSQRVSRFEFTHNLFQRYLYNQLGAGERRLLHGKVAEGLETVYQDRVEEIAGQLAKHFSIVGNTQKTTQYLQLAGERALKQYAYREAIDHLSRALEPNLDGDPDGGVADPAQLARLHGQLGQAYRGAGDLAKCQEHLLGALALLDRPIPDTPGKLLMGLLGQLTRQILHRLQPKHFIARQASQGKREILLETARIYSLLGYIYYFANEIGLSIYTTLRNLNLAELAGPSPELAGAYGYMCLAIGLVPLHGLAEAYSIRAFKVARSVNQRSNLVSVSIVTSAYKSGVGQWAAVREILEETRIICEQIGDYRQWGECLSLLASSAILAGDFSRGSELGNLLVDNARHQNNLLHQAWGLEWVSLNSLCKGQSIEAANLLEEALILLSDNAELSAEVEVYGMLALARLRLGQLQAARQAADMATERIAQSLPPGSFSLLVGYAAVAEVYLRLWEETFNNAQPATERATLAKLARQACKNCQAYKRVFPIGQPRAWLYQGQYDWLAGKQRKAHKAWRKSLEAAQRLAMPYEQGLTHYQIGRHLPADHTARQAHLSRAVELFTKLEATYYLERAEAEMQKT